MEVEPETRRSGGRIRNTLRLVGQRMTRLKDHDDQTDAAYFGSQGLSPLENTGPIPPELLKDPGLVESIPWSIQRAETRRERLVWTTIVLVSWLVSAVAILRALKVL